jgi:hypothetical protein
LKARAADIRQGQLNGIGERLDQHKTIYGQGAQLLQEIETRPDLYPQLRPKLVDLASSIDPSLAAEIPEAYEPQQVRGMLNFTTGAAQMADARSRSVAAAKLRFDERKTEQERLELDRKIVGEWFSVSPSQDDWADSYARAKDLGVSNEVLGKVGETWSPEAQERARQMLLPASERGEGRTPTTFAAAILAADRKGDVKEKARLLKLQGQMAAAGREPKDGASTVDVAGAVETIRNNPSLWGDLTPTMRDRLLVPLGTAGFNFQQAASALSETQKAQIERWRTDAITDLNKQRRDPSSPLYKSSSKPNAEADATYQSELTRIEDSYAVQMGSAKKKTDTAAAAPPAPPAGPTRGTPPPSTPRAGAVPKQVSSLLTGKKPGRYKMTDGTKWTVGANGTISPAN